MMKTTWRLVSRCSIPNWGRREAYVQPVDVLVPVGLCDGRVGDVRLFRVVLGVAVGLAGRSHRRLLVDELRLDGEVARDSLGGRHDGGVRYEDVGGMMARKLLAGCRGSRNS